MTTESTPIEQAFRRVIPKDRHHLAHNYVCQLASAGMSPASGLLIRTDVLDALRRWANGEHPHRPGSFLTACLQGDWRTAFMVADAYNLATIPAIFTWLYNNAPSTSWGTPDRYEEYLVEMMRRHQSGEKDDSDTREHIEESR